MALHETRQSTVAWREVATTGARWAVVGTAALLLGFGGVPAAFWINVYWFALLLCTVLLGGIAWGRYRAAIIGGEVLVGLVVLHGVWPVLSPNVPVIPLGAVSTNGIGWTLTFTDQSQAIAKTIVLPRDCCPFRTYVRIDTGQEYNGEAGFHVEVNGQAIGRVSLGTQKGFPWYLGDSERWLIPVPRGVLQPEAGVRVVLRPAGIDPRLSIAGHRNPSIGRRPAPDSAFFDGAVWSESRLAGSAKNEESGTYRIWLVSDIAQRE